MFIGISIASMAISICQLWPLAFAIYGHYYSLSIASMAIVIGIMAILAI